jgi:rod shape-determining protein MreB
MDEAIIQHIRHAHCLEIGELTAEAIKIELGSVRDTNDRTIEVRGRNLKTGLPAAINITSEDIWAAIEPVIEVIIQGVCNSLEEVSPEVSAGIMESGIVLTGGASQLGGLAERISEEIGIKARQVSSDAQSVAVLGAGKLFRDGSYTSIRELMVRRRAEKLYERDGGDDYSVNQAA